MHNKENIGININMPSIKQQLWSYLELCKPKVVVLMLATSLVGMLLAHGKPSFVLILASITGIALASASAATINHVIEKNIDAKMHRTQQRPVASGKVSSEKALQFAFILGLTGLAILFIWVNQLTAWLTFLTLLGYAVFYTAYLKRATPQNIVIGGAAGAAPPLLGWVAITNQIEPHALLLMLIIFAWTPPHFWALAIYKHKEYAKTELPMLPVTHGIRFTKIAILLYTVITFLVSILPFLTGMSGLIYLSSASILGIIFIYKSVKLLWLTEDKELNYSFALFKFSITYLLLIFLALLLDHFYLIYALGK